MKGERKKCLEPAASDYLAKPIDTKQLLAVLRMWLHREEVDNGGSSGSVVARSGG
jgi:DNA-binding response OmpR family regulator